jgi:diketogulonate reductase-like aldo/keto reductase
MRTTRLRSGLDVPVLGQGTWHMAEDPALWKREVEALRAGIDLGMTLIDTAEMYADGGAETLVAQAIAGHRDEVFLVSKVLPNNASPRRMLGACEASLQRLGTDWIDLYLLHWRGSTPLAAVVETFQQLQQQGHIRYWGVSNLDTDDLHELLEVDGGPQLQTNQVLYNLARRGIEFDLLPLCREREVPIMAYSPIEQGRVLKNRVVRRIASEHGATPAQVALAWVLRQPAVIAIPKAGTLAHVHENAGALEVQLRQADLAALDEAFPPPKHAVPLEML